MTKSFLNGVNINHKPLFKLVDAEIEQYLV